MNKLFHFFQFNRDEFLALYQLSPHVSEVTGTEPHDIRTFARDYARAFVGV